MDYRLVEEVLDHAPAELTPAERVVLIVLARYADFETRECYPPPELICHQTGLGPDALRKAFQRLATRDLEVRVVIGKDKRGRAVFAHKGRKTLYRLPEFAPLQRRYEGPTFDPSKAGPDSHLRAQRRDDVPAFEAQRRDESPTFDGQSRYDSPTFESDNDRFAGPKAVRDYRPNEQARTQAGVPTGNDQVHTPDWARPLIGELEALGITVSWKHRMTQLRWIRLQELIRSYGVPYLVHLAKLRWNPEQPIKFATLLIDIWDRDYDPPSPASPWHPDAIAARAAQQNAPQQPVPEPDWCGNCAEPSYRFIDQGDDRWIPCPTCHPGAHR